MDQHLLFVIWDVNPGIFPEFGLLRWYGVCWVLGILVGYQILRKIYQSENTPITELDKLTTYMVVGAILGARLGHILFYDLGYYWDNPIEILPIRIHPTFEFTGLTGLASHGGILGALTALYFYNRRLRKGYLWLLDRLMIAGAALGSFIRLGNLMNSEILGTPSNVSWAFVFIRVDQIPRHPSQLYEAIFYLVLSVGLLLAWKSKKFSSSTGFIFGLGTTLIFVQRFLIEFIKEDQVPFEAQLSLNMGQILSIPLVFVGLITVIWSLKRMQSVSEPKKE